MIKMNITTNLLKSSYSALQLKNKTEFQNRVFFNMFYKMNDFLGPD